MEFVIITGMSGAGKSQAARFLEDIGYYCIDNMPPALIPKFADMCYNSKKDIAHVALVIDIRSRDLFKDLFSAIDFLKFSGYRFQILFLDASDDVLVKRFKETRRKHPLDEDNAGVINAIKKEREMLSSLKESSDNIIDTSNMLTRELKEEISKLYVHNVKYKGIIITTQSFGFKYGLPIDSDIVLDVRFIPNPFYVESLKSLTGENKKVKEYVLNQEETKEFIKKLKDMLLFLIPNYIKEGKNNLIISIGCTGGKHRSVSITEELHKELEKEDYSVLLKHRDIQK